MEPRSFAAAEFEAVTDQRFTALVEGNEVDLELVKVDVKPGDPPDRAFSVEFTGPPEPFMPQQIYELRHEDLGSMHLFLVPVAGDEDGYTYEAMFTKVD